MSNAAEMMEMANSYKAQYGSTDSDYRLWLEKYYNEFSFTSPEAKSAARMLADSYREQYGDGDSDYRFWLERAMA